MSADGKDYETARRILLSSSVSLTEVSTPQLIISDGKSLAQGIANAIAAAREASLLPPHGTAIPRALILEALDKWQHRANRSVDDCKADARRLKSKRSRDKLDRAMYFSNGVEILALEIRRLLERQVQR